MIDIDNIKNKVKKCADMNLQDINIQDIDEITDITINRKKDSNNRIMDFLDKTKNPYFF